MDGAKKYPLAEQLTPSDPSPPRTEQHMCHWRLHLTKAVCQLRVCRETSPSPTLPSFWATGRAPLWGSGKGAKGTGNLTNGKFTWSTKVCLVKSMVFPVVMYGCESWTIKKVEHQRIDAFELWCWRRLLRVSWTARRCNQSILKEISPGCTLEGCWSWNSNTLGTWCKELTHLKRPWCWERLRAGGEGDDRGWDGWMASRTQWTWVWVNSRSCWWTGRHGVLRFMGSQRVGHDWATELNWTEGRIQLACDWVFRNRFPSCILVHH